MIKIIHFIPTLEGGGAERQLEILASEQSRNNYNVIVCVRRGGVYQEKLEKNNVKVLKIGNFSAIRIKSLLKCLDIIRNIKPDIVQSWLPQMDIYVGIIAKLIKINWVMTERSNFQAYNVHGIQHQLRKFLSKKKV